jgi:o-succinylbenzoate synthase
VTSGSPLLLRRVQRRLDPPQHNAHSVWSERSSLELALSATEGSMGWGEAAPLPDYSQDDVHDAERALAGLPVAELAALAEVDDARTLLDAAAALIPAHQPSARFALETALLDRVAQRAGQPLWFTLAALARRSACDAGTDVAPAEALAEARSVALCALLPSGDRSAALALARRHLAAGVTCFKLKIGPDHLTSDQEATLAGLRAELGARVNLRADANGSLSPAGLRSSLEQLAAHELEFLEEPMAGAEPEGLTDSPCALALDESLQRMPPAALARWLAQPAFRVLVLKPTALGGLSACIGLARVARAHGREVVVSHALEGPIGWAACAHLALALGGTRAAGLWPLAHQAAARPRIEQGRLVPTREPGLGATA